MKKRGSSAKSLSKAKSLLSPLPSPSAEIRSGEAYGFNSFVFASSSKKKGLSPASVLRSPCTPAKPLSTTSDLKDLACSGIESLKRRAEVNDTDVLKEIDASYSRISKRFKIQTQACMQLAEEAEREYKKISDKIDENMKAIKGSYVDFMAEVQAATSRVCKVSIPELAKSAEKAIEGLHGRYGITANLA
ncbi:uncharacterized protein LOC110032358 [Phalaenopsis equestris]|uniref:uncharacterized protein LOC110032358 n=1 Tax=Phalaenopsis equestris TaxID=78828 RepID=UPI0009E6384D|nr:uncharacterized protein LOC110032358 [Phalaenopsis equestris]